jgi:hypothetical protein
LPERLRGEESPVNLPQSSIVGDQNLDDEILEADADEAGKQELAISQATAELKAPPVESGKTVEQGLSTPVSQITEKAGDEISPNQEPVTANSSSRGLNAAGPLTSLGLASPDVAGRDVASNVSTGGDNGSKAAKPLFWSAADTLAASDSSGDGDQSHVPPVLRGLRKCEACGFPISGGRVLCVECEEKKWRGQLRRPQPMPTGAIAGSSPAPGSAVRSVAARAQLSSTTFSAVAAAPATKPASSPTVPESHFSQNRREVGHPTQLSTNIAAPEKQAVVPEAAVSSLVPNAAPTFVFSGGLQDSPSWFSANKYIIGALVLMAAVIAAFFLLR